VRLGKSNGRAVRINKEQVSRGVGKGSEVELGIVYLIYSHEGICDSQGGGRGRGALRVCVHVCL
jgi:hypothetical protein